MMVITITLVFQNPPVIPFEEVFGTPKGLLRRCLGVQTSTQQVLGTLGLERKKSYIKQIQGMSLLGLQNIQN